MQPKNFNQNDCFDRNWNLVRLCLSWQGSLATYAWFSSPKYAMLLAEMKWIILVFRRKNVQYVRLTAQDFPGLFLKSHFPILAVNSVIVQLCHLNKNLSGARLGSVQTLQCFTWIGMRNPHPMAPGHLHGSHPVPASAADPWTASPAQLSMRTCADEKNFWCHPASKSWGTLHSKHWQPHERPTLIFPASPIPHPPSAPRLWGCFCISSLGKLRERKGGQGNPLKDKVVPPGMSMVGREMKGCVVWQWGCVGVSSNLLTPSAELHKIPKGGWDKSSHGPQGSASLCPAAGAEGRWGSGRNSFPHSSSQFCCCFLLL